MLEFKGALMSLGFTVEAQRLTVDELANIQVPAVILAFPPDDPEVIRVEPFISHYFVLCPLDEGLVQILDYPRKPIVLSGGDWIEHLHSIDVKNIPVLLCGRYGQSLEEMLLSLEVTKGKLGRQGQ